MGKEVKEYALKSNILLDIVNLIKSGKNPSKITKQLNISKQLLSYYLKTLKSKGIIRKVGYGTWEVLKEVKIYTRTHLQGEVFTSKEVRGHAFIWVVKIPKEIKGWKDRLKILKNNNIEYILSFEPQYTFNQSLRKHLFKS